MLDSIIAAIAPRTEDLVVEIGPGEGALTARLLPRLAGLHVIEIDRDLVHMLQDRYANRPLFVHSGDALQFDFAALAQDVGGQFMRIVGNLPYNISTPLIFHLLKHCHRIHDMHFLLQKEVVDRITAEPGGKDWGRLAIMVQVHARAQSLFQVAPGAFRPPPKVQSAVVRIVPRAQPLMPSTQIPTFAALIQQAFQQRRKTLGRSLRGSPAAAALEAAGINPMARPETVTLEQWIALHQTATQRPEANPEVATRQP